MTGVAGEGSIRRIYWLTGFFSLLGCALLWHAQGFSAGLGLLLGGAVSAGNLFLFSYLSRAISPSPGESRPWEARAFISRYLLMFAGGYVIVKALGVSPVAVILGLLASTAAAVSSIVLELFERLFTRFTTR